MIKTIISLLVVLFSVSTFAAEAKYRIKWILAHEPARVFLKAANEFSEKIKSKSNGEIIVEIVNPENTQDEKYKNMDVKTAFELVQKGELQMSQTYTTYLGNYDKQMWILDLPFLFKNHDHASKVLDGKIGKKILAGLSAADVQGLAFTYSGGYRIIPSQSKPLNTAADFEGQKIAVTADSPVAQSYLKELKAEPVPVSDATLSDGKMGDAFETTYARLSDKKHTQMKYLNETEHTLFLTSILINKKFFDSLPKKYQKLISETALEVARFERAESLKDNEKTKERFINEFDLKLVNMKPQEVEKMKKAAQPVYEKFSKILDAQIIAEIKNSGN